MPQKKKPQGGPRKEGERSLESFWNNPNVFKRYDTYRALFRPETTDVVMATLQQHRVPEDGINIEIGAGLGELVDNIIPEGSGYKNIRQTEQGPAILAQRRGSNVERLNVKDIAQRIAPKVDTFIGFSSFDTFDDLRGAIHSMKQALKPGGQIVHFLDLYPSPNTLLHNIDMRKRIPFPWQGNDGALGVVMIERSNLAQVMQGMGKEERITFLEYMRDPHGKYIEIYQAEKVAAEWGRIQRTVDTTNSEVIRFDEYFYNRFRAALIAEGLEIKEFGVREASYVVDKEDADDPRGYIAHGENYAINDVGDPLHGVNPALNLPPGQARIMSRVHVVVARKPE